MNGSTDYIEAWASNSGGVSIGGTSDYTNFSGSLLANSVTTTAGGATPISALSAATNANTIDNGNFTQNWNWASSTSQNALSLSANALTTGSLLSLTSSSAGLNSTAGLVNIANTSASTLGTVLRVQANSTAGSGLTVLANGTVAIGTNSPVGNASLNVQANVGSYNAITLQNNSLNGTGKGAIITGARATNANVPFSGIGVFDSGIARKVYIGGGNWNQTDADQIDFYTSPTYSEGLNSGQLRMIIVGNGNVGIGTGAPSAKLSVNGDANNTTGVWGVFSDLRSKDNVQPYTRGLTDLLKLNPVTFTYKPEFEMGSSTHVGFIAQDLQTAVPEMVSNLGIVRGIDNFLENNQEGLMQLIINAIKEIALKISNMAEEIVTKTIKTEILCVGNNCVNEQQFGEMMLGNAITVPVATNTSPVITVLGTNPATVNVGDVYTDAGATATDAQDGSLTSSIVTNIIFGGATTSAVDTSSVGTYQVAYTVVDSHANAVTVYRTVNVVVATTAPATTTSIAITLTGDNPQTIASTTTSYTDLGATALDDLNQTIPVTNDSVDIMTAANLAAPATYTITYTASNAGVTATSTRQVIIQ
jgi:hypothetical protein